MMPNETQSTGYEMPPALKHAIAWVVLCLALALHVVDEALTGFLSVYNPAVDSIRSRLPWLPIPTFTFEAWLGGLIVAVLVLSALTLPVLRGARVMIPVSYVFGLLMLANALLHIGASLQFGHPAPGVYSAPLLLASSAFLIVTVHQHRRRIET